MAGLGNPAAAGKVVADILESEMVGRHMLGLAAGNLERLIGLEADSQVVEDSV